MCLAAFAINDTTVVNKSTNLPPEVPRSAKQTSIRLKNWRFMKLPGQPSVFTTRKEKQKITSVSILSAFFSSLGVMNFLTSFAITL